MVFQRLWLGQLLSNLGTQVSLYAIALWLFRSTGGLGGLVAVAVVVLLSKLAILPALTRWLPRCRLRPVMLAANLMALLGTLTLVTLLLHRGSLPPLYLLLFLSISAAAEGTLAVCLATLVPRLVAPDQRAAANGWLGAADGLVNLAAPFLAALVVLQLALPWVALLDASTTALALATVAWGAWPRRASRPRPVAASAPPWQLGTRQRLRALLTVPISRALLLLGGALMATCASLEILFPAWIVISPPVGGLGSALVLSGIAYGGGALAWQRLGLPRGRWRIWLLAALLGQGLLLLAVVAVVPGQRPVLWLIGVAGFNFSLPIVAAALPSLWQAVVPPPDQPAYFAARYGFEWLARLAGFGLSWGLVERVLRPALAADGPLAGLNTGASRPLTLVLALFGAVQVLVVLWQGPPLLAAPLRPLEGIGAVQGRV